MPKFRDVFIGMNSLLPGARHRRKQDVAEIRHIYLDFDDNAAEAVGAMRARADMPAPNHIIESSPGRYQTIWRVEGFELNQAEQLMRGMVRELGADPAAVDASRVMRLPGLYSHKRDLPFFIRVQTLTDEIYRPIQFPAFALTEAQSQTVEPALRSRSHASNGTLTQSERDWKQIKRSLALGADPAQLTQSLAIERSDKPNPRYYAELTVSKAQRALEQEREARGNAVEHPRPRSQNGIGIGG